MNFGRCPDKNELRVAEQVAIARDSSLMEQRAIVQRIFTEQGYRCTLPRFRRILNVFGMAEEQIISAFEDALVKTGYFRKDPLGRLQTLGLLGTEQTPFESFFNVAQERFMDMETNLDDYIRLINANVEGWNGDKSASNYLALKHYADHLNANKDLLLKRNKLEGSQFKIGGLEKFKALFLALALYDLNDAADIFQFHVKYNERLDLLADEYGRGPSFMFNFNIARGNFEGDDFFKYLYFMHYLLGAARSLSLDQFTVVLRHLPSDFHPAEVVYLLGAIIHNQNSSYEQLATMMRALGGSRSFQVLENDEKDSNRDEVLAIGIEESIPRYRATCLISEGLEKTWVLRELLRLMIQALGVESYVLQLGVARSLDPEFGVYLLAEIYFSTGAYDRGMKAAGRFLGSSEVQDYIQNLDTFRQEQAAAHATVQQSVSWDFEFEAKTKLLQQKACLSDKALTYDDLHGLMEAKQKYMDGRAGGIKKLIKDLYYGMMQRWYGTGEEETRGEESDGYHNEFVYTVVRDKFGEELKAEIKEEHESRKKLRTRFRDFWILISQSAESTDPTINSNPATLIDRLIREKSVIYDAVGTLLMGQDVPSLEELDYNDVLRRARNLKLYGEELMKVLSEIFAQVTGEKTIPAEQFAPYKITYSIAATDNSSIDAGPWNIGALTEPAFSQSEDEEESVHVPSLHESSQDEVEASSTNKIPLPTRTLRKMKKVKKMLEKQSEFMEQATSAFLMSKERGPGWEELLLKRVRQLCTGEGCVSAFSEWASKTWDAWNQYGNQAETPPTVDLITQTTHNLLAQIISDVAALFSHPSTRSSEKALNLPGPLSSFCTTPSCIGLFKEELLSLSESIFRVSPLPQGKAERPSMWEEFTAQSSISDHLQLIKSELDRYSAQVKELSKANRTIESKKKQEIQKLQRQAERLGSEATQLVKQKEETEEVMKALRSNLSQIHEYLLTQEEQMTAEVDKSEKALKKLGLLCKAPSGCFEGITGTIISISQSFLNLPEGSGTWTDIADSLTLLGLLGEIELRTRGLQEYKKIEELQRLLGEGEAGILQIKQYRGKVDLELQQKKLDYQKTMSEFERHKDEASKEWRAINTLLEQEVPKATQEIKALEAEVERLRESFEKQKVNAEATKKQLEARIENETKEAEKQKVAIARQIEQLQEKLEIMQRDVEAQNLKLSEILAHEQSLLKELEKEHEVLQLETHKKETTILSQTETLEALRAKTSKIENEIVALQKQSKTSEEELQAKIEEKNRELKSLRVRREELSEEAKELLRLENEIAEIKSINQMQAEKNRAEEQKIQATRAELESVRSEQSKSTEKLEREVLSYQDQIKKASEELERVKTLANRQKEEHEKRLAEFEHEKGELIKKHKEQREHSLNEIKQKTEEMEKLKASGEEELRRLGKELNDLRDELSSEENMAEKSLKEAHALYQSQKQETKEKWRRRKEQIEYEKAELKAKLEREKRELEAKKEQLEIEKRTTEQLEAQVKHEAEEAELQKIASTKRIKELQEELEVKHEEWKAQNTELSKLRELKQSQLEELKRKLKEVEEQRLELSKLKDLEHSQLEELEKESNMVESKTQEKKRVTLEQMAKLEKLKASKSEIENEMLLLQKQSETSEGKLQSEIEKKKRELESLRSETGELSNKAQELLRLENDVIELKKTNHIQEEKNKVKEKEVEDARAKLESLRSEQNKVKEELERQVRSHQGQVEEASKELEEVKELVRKEEEEHEEKLATLKKDKEDLVRKQNEERNGHLSKIKRTIEEMERTKAYGEEKLQELEKELDELRKRLLGEKNLMEQTLQNAKVIHESQMKEVQKEWEQRKEKLESEKIRLQQLLETQRNKESEEIKRLEAVLDSLGDEIRNAEQQVLERSRELQERVLHEQSVLKRLEILELSGDLQLKELRTELAGKNWELTKLRLEATERSLKNEQTKVRTDELYAELARLRAKVVSALVANIHKLEPILSEQAEKFGISRDHRTVETVMIAMRNHSRQVELGKRSLETRVGNLLLQSHIGTRTNLGSLLDQGDVAQVFGNMAQLETVRKQVKAYPDQDVTEKLEETIGHLAKLRESRATEEEVRKVRVMEDLLGSDHDLEELQDHVSRLQNAENGSNLIEILLGLERQQKRGAQATTTISASSNRPLASQAASPVEMQREVVSTLAFAQRLTRTLEGIKTTVGQYEERERHEHINLRLAHELADALAILGGLESENANLVKHLDALRSSTETEALKKLNQQLLRMTEENKAVLRRALLAQSQYDKLSEDICTALGIDNLSDARHEFFNVSEVVRRLPDDLDQLALSKRLQAVLTELDRLRKQCPATTVPVPPTIHRLSAVVMAPKGGLVPSASAKARSRKGGESCVERINQWRERVRKNANQEAPHECVSEIEPEQISKMGRVELAWLPFSKLNPTQLRAVPLDRLEFLQWSEMTDSKHELCQVLQSLNQRQLASLASNHISCVAVQRACQMDQLAC